MTVVEKESEMMETEQAEQQESTESLGGQKRFQTIEQIYIERESCEPSATGVLGSASRSA